jgi:solute carrier family 25 protein 39/40
MVTVVAPLELIRTKLQSERLTYGELARAVASACAAGGWRALWLGWAPMMMRDVPFSAIYWAGYETAKAKLIARSRRHQSTFAISFAAGAAAGTVASLVTLPLDVIKTRRQIQIGQALVVGAAPPERSTWRLALQLYNDHGVRGLFTGVCGARASLTYKQVVCRV